MTAGTGVLRTLDAALDAVARAERRGLRTRDGKLATGELHRLRTALASERDRVRNGERSDVAALGAIVRDVAAWSPDDELNLLAVLGAVVGAARQAT